jgi:hypothetical protein
MRDASIRGNAAGNGVHNVLEGDLGRWTSQAVAPGHAAPGHDEAEPGQFSKYLSQVLLGDLGRSGDIIQ